MDILQQSLIDLRLDFSELTALTLDYLEKLTVYSQALHKQQHWCSLKTKEVQQNITDVICQQLVQLSSEIRKASDSTFSSLNNWDTLNNLSTQKKQYKEILRSFVGLIAQTIAATDWQSPSFLTSSISQAGRQTGLIQATVNDYKRDLHLDAHNYEQLFRKEYLDTFLHLPVQIYATASGQAAFSTILSYLHGEKRMQGSVLVGEHVYFENIWLLKKTVKEKCIIIPETPQAIATAIKTYSPSALFLDSLSNTQQIHIPDLTPICDVVHKISYPFSFILDNTGLTTFFQLFKHFPPITNNLHIIGFESLNKYHQFGFDRTTGGIIYALGANVGKISDYRVHTGSIISDIAALSLPTPNRLLLQKRLKRHERNAQTIASYIQKAIEEKKIPCLDAVIYPNASGANNSLFLGSYLTLALNKPYNSIKQAKKIISTVIDRAKKHQGDIISGTSFGFDTTRIYLTAEKQTETNPFIRISAGTEHLWQIIQLAQIIVDTLKTI